MRYTAKIGSLLGIPVRIHVTFPLILIFLGAEAWLNGSWQEALWAVALIFSVFVCVVLHELGHSLQVRRYGIAVKDIVLLPIGGMARVESIPEVPRQEIIVAISGPAVNFTLAGLFMIILLVKQAPIDLETDFIANLFAINIVLGTFNLIPAFPMDGGRILRGLLALRMPYIKATRYARSVGQLIAILFVITGFVDNRFIMLSVIAIFIYFGATNEERMIKIKYGLRGKCLGDLLPDETPLVTDGISIADLADVFHGVRGAALPVTDEAGKAVGAVTRKDVAQALRAGRVDQAVSTILTTGFPLLGAETPAVQGYFFLKSGRHSFCGLVRDGVFVGLIFTADIQNLIA